MTGTTLSPLDGIGKGTNNGLSYVDSKSEWIRQTVRFRQYVNPILEEVYESHQHEERLELVEKAIREKVDELKREKSL